MCRHLVDIYFLICYYVNTNILSGLIVSQLLLNKYRVLYNYLDFKSETASVTNGVMSLDKNAFPDSKIKDWTAI